MENFVPKSTKVRCWIFQTNDKNSLICREGLFQINIHIVHKTEEFKVIWMDWNLFICIFKVCFSLESSFSPCIMLIAVSIVWYWTLQNCCGIWWLIELPSGKDKINLNSPGVFLRTNPGGTCLYGNGGNSKGPAMCFNFMSLKTRWWRMLSFPFIDDEFCDNLNDRGPW